MTVVVQGEGQVLAKNPKQSHCGSVSVVLHETVGQGDGE